jgi:hypothetical protein
MLSLRCQTYPNTTWSSKMHRLALSLAALTLYLLCPTTVTASFHILTLPSNNELAGCPSDSLANMANACNCLRHGDARGLTSGFYPNTAFFTMPKGFCQAPQLNFYQNEDSTYRFYFDGGTEIQGQCLWSSTHVSLPCSGVSYDVLVCETAVCGD